MTSLVTSDTETLIGQLDPNRDYGDGGFDGLVAAIRSGEVLIRPAPEGTRQPLLAWAKSGVRVKGTGAPLAGKKNGWEQFVRRTNEDIDIWYDRLFDLAHDEKNPMVAVKAIEAVLKYSYGTPNKPSLELKVDDKLLALLQSHEERVIEVKAT